MVRYHGSLAARVRREEQDRFMNGDARLMVATNVFGMRIDKPDVRFIIHDQIHAAHRSKSSLLTLPSRLSSGRERPNAPAIPDL